MASRGGLFEANVRFSSPFGVIFSANLTGPILSYFSARSWPAVLTDGEVFETEQGETVEYSNGN